MQLGYSGVRSAICINYFSVMWLVERLMAIRGYGRDLSRCLARLSRHGLWLCLGLYVAPGQAAASAEACAAVVAHVVSVQGRVEFHRAGQPGWHPAQLNTFLCVGDRVRVRSRSRAALRLSNETMLRLDQKTAITIVDPETGPSTLLELMNGAMHVITRTPKPFKIRTPVVNASVEGTEFFISTQQPQASIVVFEGKVSVVNAQGRLMLTNGEAAVVHKAQPPRREILLEPLDAVQWALHYPAVIDYRLDAESEARLPEAVRNALAYYRLGKLTEALSELDRLAVDAHTIESLLHRAGLLLVVGQAEEAQRDLGRALQLEPDNSDALALQAVVAVTQNDKAAALRWASQAVELNPASSMARLALSYAQQAHFQIKPALDSVAAAVRFDPGHVLAWARLAELHMSMGELDQALAAARRAVDLDPGLAKTQTVLGFAHLLRIDMDQASTIFGQAIALDQADPMPRLGLGLALVRQGRLAAGRRALEIAASLDPANSLVRSYLGKVYFEEKQYGLASTQYDLARTRDPQDPTPWFYDAIQKQTQNRPIEALRDIQKSIELNDNRAVYRSRLLLDQDQAGRGASLARIYDNLGLQRRALVETASSLSFDPANHSAHRFLSDAYASIPRHEIARVSELLQAQLLQPVNVNPVQPRMAVADLNIITHTGPAVAGFNEFAPLMARNRPQLVASGLYGSDRTLGDEVVFFAVYDRASISLGQFHFSTRGFRRNDLDPDHPDPGRSRKDSTLIQSVNNHDVTHDIYNAFLQYALTPKFNLQAELVSRRTAHGDFAAENLYHRDYNPYNRRTLREDSVRIGARYALLPRQDFLLSAKYVDRRENFTGMKFPASGKQIEAQHILKQDSLRTVTGGAVYRYSFDNQSPFFALPGRLHRESVYSYLYLNALASFDVTLGLGYDSFTGANSKKAGKVNPKIGLQWYVNDYLQLRSAWFETTKSHLLGQQTLEPTQIAGFNQFFDDPNATRTRRTGIGLDARAADNLYGGAEVSERTLRIPLMQSETLPEASLAAEKQRERWYRLYLNWLLDTSWSIKAELQFERVDRRGYQYYLQPRRIDTLSAPVSIEYFHASGFFAKFSTTYVKQQQWLTGLPKEEHDDPWNGAGTSDFMLLDAIAGFRLPNRRGLLSLEVRNLLDKTFFYRQPYFFTSEPHPRLYSPTRTLFGKLTLNF